MRVGTIYNGKLKCKVFGVFSQNDKFQSKDEKLFKGLWKSSVPDKTELVLHLVQYPAWQWSVPDLEEDGERGECKKSCRGQFIESPACSGSFF